MVRIRSPKLAGTMSAASLVAPVVAGMIFRHQWNWFYFALAVGLSVPFYFLARNKVLLERYHPGWRGED